MIYYKAKKKQTNIANMKLLIFEKEDFEAKGAKWNSMKVTKKERKEMQGPRL